MVIALVSPDFPSEGRPTYIFVQQLVFALVDMGLDVHVIAPQSLTHALFRHESVLNKKTVELTNNGNRFNVYRPYSVTLGDRFTTIQNVLSYCSNISIAKIIKKINPDIIYCHFWDSALKVYNFALKNNKPLFVACGEGDDALENMVSTISDNLKLQLVKSVSGVISVSSENKRKCISYGLAIDKNIIVLPNCVDQTIFHPSDGKNQRDKLGVSADDFLIIFVGGFIKRKGVDKLCAALNQLNDKDIKAVFIGKPLGGDVVEPNYERIVYKGPLNHDNLPLFLNAADVFVLPTMKEGCSNAIVEALATGIPVISSNRAFNEDILNEDNSMMVNPESPNEIAEAIKILKDNKDLYNSKKLYAKQHSCDFSIVERAKKIVSFIESFLIHE